MGALAYTHTRAMQLHERFKVTYSTLQRLQGPQLSLLVVCYLHVVCDDQRDPVRREVRDMVLQLRRTNVAWHSIPLLQPATVAILQTKQALNTVFGSDQHQHSGI